MVMPAGDTMLSLVVAGCQAPGTTLIEGRSPGALAQQQILLTATDPAPGAMIDLRLRGLPDTTYKVVIDDPTGQRSVGGVKWGAGRVVPLLTMKTGLDGWADATASAPATSPFAVGQTRTLRAGIDNAPLADDLSPRVFLPVVAVQEPPVPYNILVLLADDMGIDRLELYDKGDAEPDYWADLQPGGLERLADEGVLFYNAWSLPICGPTRSALQTGQLPRRTGWGDNAPILSFDPGPVEWPVDFTNGEDIELDPGFITLAELVKLSPWHNYQTALIGKWELTTPWGSSSDNPDGYVGSVHNQGWDFFQGTVAGLIHWTDDPALSPETPTDPLDYDNYGFYDDTNGYVSATEYATTQQATNASDWIAAQEAAEVNGEGPPWLLHLSFNAAHAPMHTPPANFQTTGNTHNEQHRQMIEAMDHEIAGLLDDVTALAEPTLVIFLADNGSATQSSANDVDEPKERMKGSLYEGGVRIPFLVAGFNVDLELFETGEADTLVHVVDVFPTLAALIGVDTSELPSNLDPQIPLALDGVSFLSVLDEPTAPNDPNLHEVLYAEEFLPGGADSSGRDEITIRNADYKLVYDVSNDLPVTFFRYDHVDGRVTEAPPGSLPPTIPPAAQADLDNYNDLMAQWPGILAGLAYDSAEWP
jgi:arylsulfatase A-like enzyme